MLGHQLGKALLQPATDRFQHVHHHTAGTQLLVAGTIPTIFATIIVAPLAAALRQRTPGRPSSCGGIAAPALTRAAGAAGRSALSPQASLPMMRLVASCAAHDVRFLIVGGYDVAAIEELSAADSEPPPP
jgi:hypothetical protein